MRTHRKKGLLKNVGALSAQFSNYKESLLMIATHIQMALAGRISGFYTERLAVQCVVRQKKRFSKVWGSKGLLERAVRQEKNGFSRFWGRKEPNF